MPTFPTYDGYLPQCLNPLNPRHYLLVLYWVFFRPTALKCYLYQASPEIYKSDGGWKNFVTVITNPIYRNLFIVGLISNFFVVILTVYLSYFVSTSIQCSDIPKAFWENVSKYEICQNLAIGLQSQKWKSIANWMTGVFYNSASQVLMSVALSMMSVLMIIALGIKTHMAKNAELCLISGMVFGIIFGGTEGTTLSVVYLVMQSLMLSITIGRVSSVAFAIIYAVILAVSKSPIAGLILGLSALRLPFYLLECINSLIQSHKRKSNLIIWDELSVLPIIYTRNDVIKQFHHNSLIGLKSCAQIIGNPFQAWAVQNSAWLYLEQSQSPIEQIYNWAKVEELDRYAHIPNSHGDWRYNISSRQMLFAELAGVSLSAYGEVLSGFSNLPRLLTNYLRRNASTELRELIIFFLLSLLPEITDVDKLLQALRYNSSIALNESLNNYNYGLEIRESLSNINAYLNFSTPQAIATAPTHLTWLNPTDTFLRPTVIQSLITLSTISQSIHRANIASSPLNQRNAILTANDALEQLKTYVTKNVHPNYPEQKLLHRIIDQWQTIITKAGGELGRTELLEPIENPYIAGPPVTGQLFVGREDILTTLEELWLKPGQVESVIIFGHRRMGKTSILRNLPGRLTPTTHIINFNIQTLGTLSTSQLILALAQNIYDDLPLHILIPEPIQADFPTPEKDFRRWLKKLEPHRNKDDRFIIAIDEFELIEAGIREGRLSQSLIGHWRGILNDFPWIIFAFAGLHTLQEMTQDYWNPLFGSVRKIPITFLSQAAAKRLITQPSEDFPIDYDAEAIAHIYHLTHGQPYLTQLICQNLITRFNRQRFEEQREIEPRFTIDDINTIITDPNFFNDGSAYFRGIWDQAQETSGPTQLAILRELAIAPTSNLQAQAAEDFAIALDLLLTHDVIQKNNQSHYSYRVELMRQWVQKTQP